MTTLPVAVYDLLHRIVLALYEAEDVPDGSAERALLRAANRDQILDVTVVQAVEAGDVVKKIEVVWTAWAEKNMAAGTVLGGRVSGTPRPDDAEGTEVRTVPVRTRTGPTVRTIGAFGIPYSVSELKAASDQATDPYYRDLLAWAWRQLTSRAT